MNILIVLTSHDQLGNTGQKTGFWLEELASPYYVFKEANANMTLATPNGGYPPLDPKSDEADYQTEATERFKGDEDAQSALSSTLKLSDIVVDNYDAVFFPGGHGPLWDLAEDPLTRILIETMYAANKPIAAVCHAPAVFRHVKTPDGSYLIEGKSVTGFSNTEEEAVQLVDIVPFLLEDELKAKGANYSKGDDWNSYVIADGNLITGQNPASSASVAQVLLEKIKR